MRYAIRFAAVGLLLFATSCAPNGGADKDVVPEYFGERDLKRLERFGGTYVPAGEGSLAIKTPVDSIHFDKRTLDDRSFYDVFPAVQRMDPRILSLDGHKITDRSIERINRLKSLIALSLQNTNVTMKGLRKLNVGRLQTLHVSEEKFNEKDRAELAELMKQVGRDRM
jgi:hypothetical protein